MPNYKNRPSMGQDTEVWRYASYNELIDILQFRRLRLTRIDTFDDPFEGSVPKKQFEDQQLPFTGAYAAQAMFASSVLSPRASPQPPLQDPWENTKKLRQAYARSAHASCWTAGPESEAMWRLYCADYERKGRGVAFQCTLGNLEKSVGVHDLFVSPIRYHDYQTGDAFNDDMDRLMSKRKSFDHEREVRLLHYDNAHYEKLASNIFHPSVRLPQPLDKHIYIPWPVAEVIEKITISPYADASYEGKVREQLAIFGHSLVHRVELSVLSERRSPPLR